jgi:serine/threonine-protein kinase
VVGAPRAPEDLRPGDRIGSYRIDGIVGEGGAGIVFRAIREPDGGIVALKLLRTTAARDPVFARRFQHETRAARQLRHPNLVPLLDAGDDEGRPFIVSRYMAGGSLAQQLRVGPLDVGAAVQLVAEVAAGLDALHAAGIVHRDVTPGNVLLEPDGSAALGDFGLARSPRDTALTTPGRAVGTLDYLAPEVIRGSPANAASDLYALGCVAYAALSGAAPFAGGSMMQTAFGHLERVPTDPLAGRSGVPGALGPAVLGALAKEPADRPPSATDYARALAQAVGRLPATGSS